MSNHGYILRCFVNADLRNGHQGLAAMAKKDRISVDQLEAGQYLVFINTAKNKMKVYTANNIVAYLRLNRGRIDLATISKIPQSFQGGDIHYDDALKSRLLETLEIKSRQVSALEVFRASRRAGVM